MPNLAPSGVGSVIQISTFLTFSIFIRVLTSSEAIPFRLREKSTHNLSMTTFQSYIYNVNFPLLIDYEQ